MTSAQLKGIFMNLFRNPWAIILLVLLVILLFGANKLPGLARNMGKSMRIFKTEVEELRGNEGEDDEDDDRRGQRAASRDSRDRDDRDRGHEREYDPRDHDDRAEREPVRAREDDDPYRRD